MYPSYQINEKYYPFYIFCLSMVRSGQSDKINYFGYFDRNIFMRRFGFDETCCWLLGWDRVGLGRGSFEIFIV